MRCDEKNNVQNNEEYNDMQKSRSKCEAVACLSSQEKCNVYKLFIVHFIYGE